MTNRTRARRAAAILTTAAFLSIAPAQTGPDIVSSQAFNISVETRLSILENRMGRLESDVARLGNVPTALARIEEKLTALTERATGSANTLETLGTGIIMSLATFMLTRAFTARKHDTKT